jgi:hypothetical protein
MMEPKNQCPNIISSYSIILKRKDWFLRSSFMTILNWCRKWLNLSFLVVATVVNLLACNEMASLCVQLYKLEHLKPAPAEFYVPPFTGAEPCFLHRLFHNSGNIAVHHAKVSCVRCRSSNKRMVFCQIRLLCLLLVFLTEILLSKEIFKSV